MHSRDLGSQAYDITHDYIPCGDAVIDGTIRGIVRSYFADLINGERAQFKQMNAKTKLNTICWQKGLNPERRSESAQLKALLFARPIAHLALLDYPAWTEHKHLTTFDPYWNQVDSNLVEHVQGLSERNGGEFYPQTLDLSTDQDTGFVTLATIRDFNVYRRDLIRGGVSIHSEFLTAHNTRDLAELTS